MSAPEIRIDQLTGLRTILAPGRAERPDAFEQQRRAPSQEALESCPFCEGREDRTPPELWAARPSGGPPDTPGWSARAVPNLYPILGETARGEDLESESRGGGADREARGSSSTESARARVGGPQVAESGFASAGDPLHESRRAGEPDLFRSLPAEGDHEVIVSSPDHVTTLSDLSEEQFAAAVSAWRERMRVCAESASYCHLIVNEGAEAGASLEHSHAQLYGLPFVPAAIARERERFGAYNDRTMGGHLLSDVVADEVRRGDRLVAVDDEAVLICPWASRAPFELRVIPRTPAPRFEADGVLGTAMLRTALIGLARVFGESPPLSLWVRTAPDGAEEFHWHIDVAPRLTIPAGFELGTGVEINVYPPERAAADLREAIGDVPSAAL